MDKVAFYYDEEIGVVDIRFGERKRAAVTVLTEDISEIGVDVNVDIDDEGNIINIEILLPKNGKVPKDGLRKLTSSPP